MLTPTQDRFPGFKKEYEKSYWQFPTIINGHVHSLSGAEFKVLWYILRHTFGWQKNADYLSLSQICKGIKKRNGEWVDKGTGLSRKWVIKSLTLLESKGFIVIKKTIGKTSMITPRFIDVKTNGLGNKVHQSGVESTPAPRGSTGVESTPTINNIPTNNNNRGINREKIQQMRKALQDKIKGF